MTASSTFLLQTRDLARYFGGLRAVDGVDFDLPAGEFHAIIGPNGAGKTTFLNLLSGVLKPTRGRILFQGRDITALPPHRMAHLGIGRSYQVTNIFPSLPVLENVRLAAQALGKDNFRLFTPWQRLEPCLRRAHAVLEQVGLHEQAALPAAALPHGDKRRLELAMLLAQDPLLLLLDEPTAGLATAQVPAFMHLVQEVAASGNKTVILVEHNMSVVMRLSQRVTVMHQGRILAQGTPQEIAGNPQVQEAYLGTLYADEGVGI
ncbi:MAG: ABC transporter ATP-binding protein [Anaerolineales bacterium]